MSSAAHNFALLDPASLPLAKIAIDVWIIRNQDVILTQHYNHDQGLNWQFAKFIEDIQTKFDQTITVQRQDYNQVLVLRDQQFSFVNFDSDTMYLCKNTTHLTHLATLFAQIIEQENSFLLELTTFQSMLQQSEIISTTIKPVDDNAKPIAKRSVIRTNDSFFTEHALFSANVSTKNLVSTDKQNSDFRFSKIKRSLGDIFTPYSVTSIGDTANLNYKKMNSNFNSIHVTETKLAHAQTTLSKSFNDLQTHEVELLKKEIYLELRTLKETALNSFIFDLKQILSTNHLDKSYDIIFSLLRNSEFCFQSLCYSLPIFSSMDKSLVAVSVQSTQQSLARGYFVSCTILPNHRTSIYSHTMAIYENDQLHFKKQGLASVSFSDLKRPDIDSLSRPIQEEDKLVNLFYPIYNGKKVSLQCLEPTAIIVDGENMYCNDVSLQFIPFPQTITVNGKTILSVHLPQHFSMKISKMTHDFEIMSKFQPLNNTSPGLVQGVVSYFEVAQTIHWSLLTLVLFSSVCIILLICFCSYLKCPHIISKIFTCCCETSCCLVKCLSQRIRDREIIRTNMSTDLKEQSV